MNKKGVAVISLVIMIIVIVLITSITVYNGISIVDNSRKKATDDRLMTIAVAIVAHEKELGYGDNVYSTNDTSVPEEDRYVEISSGDYVIMGLEEYKNTANYPPTFVYKMTEDKKRIYKLRTPVTVKKSGVYEEKDFASYTYQYYDALVEENYKIEFDSYKGVNRPLLTKDMKPVITYFDNNGDSKSRFVEDIYTEDWYNYSVDSPIWANVIMNDNIMYVWIPRFAYRIQSLYLSSDYKNVPASAIDVVFLKGTSDYMKNEEVLPTGYQVHPAFKYKERVGGIEKEVNIPGFWVAKNNIDNMVAVLYKTSEGSSVEAATDKVLFSALHPGADGTNVKSHLIKNTEWAAVAYLSHHTVGRCTNGMSLNPINPSGVFDLDVPCYVAGGLSSSIPSNDLKGLSHADKYTLLEPYDDGKITYDSYEDEGKRYGDGLIGTSSGHSDASAWFGGTSIKPSAQKPFIVRGIDDNLFAYDATPRSPTRGLGCRNVLIVDSK